MMRWRRNRLSVDRLRCEGRSVAFLSHGLRWVCDWIDVMDLVLLSLPAVAPFEWGELIMDMSARSKKVVVYMHVKVWLSPTTLFTTATKAIA